MIEVSGAGSFQKFSKAVNRASHDFAGDFSKAAMAALKPLPQHLDEAIEDRFPRRGGYATTVKRNAKRILKLRGGARFSLLGRRDFRQLDRGILRHPLFGDRDRWYQQRIIPGFWSKTTGAAAVRAEAEMKAALQRMANQINRAAK